MSNLSSMPGPGDLWEPEATREPPCQLDETINEYGTIIAWCAVHDQEWWKCGAYDPELYEEEPFDD